MGAHASEPNPKIGREQNHIFSLDECFALWYDSEQNLYWSEATGYLQVPPEDSEVYAAQEENSWKVLTAQFRFSVILEWSSSACQF